MAAISVDVHSRPHILDSESPERTEFDRLIFLSGIVMRSDSADFGGFSGLLISDDGTRILAVNDAGKWLEATLDYKNERLMGLTDVSMSPLLDAEGQEMSDRQGIDSESLALQQTGKLDDAIYVSFEGNHRVLYYPDGLKGKASPQKMPSGLLMAPSNKGVEAFEKLSDGRFVALAEEYLNADGNHTGWLIDNNVAHRIHMRREGMFDPTDLEQLPNGDLLVLERRYSVLGGPGMQIRRIRADSIKPDALLDGEVLVNLTARYGIDNFEGLAARQNAVGETIIYLISDNNFNPLQKNLLLMFKLKQQP